MVDECIPTWTYRKSSGMGGEKAEDSSVSIKWSNDVFRCNLESFDWTIGTSQHADSGKYMKKVRGNCPKNWPFLKCRGKNPQKSYFDVFRSSEFKSGLSLAPKSLDLPILNWSGLAVPDCTVYVLMYNS